MKIRDHIGAVWTSGRRPGPRGTIAEWAVTLALFFFGTSTLVQAYVIPTGSMESTILIGDHVLVDRLAYSDAGVFGRALLPYRDIARGDMIVFPYPVDPSQSYIKRVIGLPGDRIHMEDGQVVRNGKRLVEPYTQHVARWADRYRDNFPQDPPSVLPSQAHEMLERHQQNGEIVVPPGMLFAMGDNRQNSSDSRYWGFVPRDTVKGRPLVIYWSYDASTEDLIEWKVSHLVDVGLHFFSKTRWERTFRIPRTEVAQ